jgi:hypothetical protein
MKKLFIISICLLTSVLSATTSPLPITYKVKPFLLIGNPFTNNFPLDADGIFYITQTKFRVVGDNDYSLYGAQSSLFAKTGDTSSAHFIGDVVLNDSTRLFYIDSTYKVFGMDLSQDTSFQWQFNDSSSNPAARVQSQYITTKPLVNISSFNLDNIDTNIYRSTSFSYSHPAIHADSILYILSSDSIRIQKKVVGSSTGISFSASDMTALSASNSGCFFIFIYNVMPVTLNTKKYYFLNNSMAIVSLLHIF